MSQIGKTFRVMRPYRFAAANGSALADREDSAPAWPSRDQLPQPVRRKLSQTVDHDVCLPELLASRRTNEANACHTRAIRRLDPMHRILDDRAIPRYNAQSLRRQLKHLWVRFAPRDVAPSDNRAELVA